MTKKRTIPKKWKKCPKFGQLIAGTFFPFKVPLDESYNSKLSDDLIFTPNMLFNYVKHINVNIGLWIDLTFTDRYYKKEQIEKQGIQYFKIKCQGNGECPSLSQVNLFISICADFLKRNPDKIIGVHCTHGFNRTGFLICSYLIKQASWGLNEALTVFKAARQPGIFKQVLLNKLFRLYGDANSNDSMIQCPQLPSWYNENDDSDDKFVHNDDRHQSNIIPKLVLEPYQTN